MAYTIRGLQALSVQFQFAFSKPYSSQTRFLNRPVAAPAEVAHFCRYIFFYFSTNLRFEFAFWSQFVDKSIVSNIHPSKRKLVEKEKKIVATEVGYFGGRRNWTV